MFGYGPRQHHNENGHVLDVWATHVESGFNYLIKRTTKDKNLRPNHKAN